MELRQLKYFVEVAETLNFSDAARNLCITQSTLSQQVKQLEQEFGTQLLQRNSHTVSLTEAGEQMLPYARQTLHSANLCFDRVHDLQEMLTGTLNIGVTFSFSPILTETLVVFMKRYPHVRLNIYYKTMDELMDMLSARKIDFVLAFRPVAPYADIESHILFDNHLSAILSDGHPLARKDKVTLDDIARYDIALPAKGLQARYAFDRIRENAHNDLHVRIELNEVNILLKLVRQSMLVGILSEATTYDTDGIKAIPIDRPENEMQGCVHTLRNTYRKHAMLRFIKMLSEANAVRERVSEWIR